VKVRGLEGLKAIAKTLEAQRLQAQAEAAEKARLAALAEQHRQQFALAVGTVKVLKPHGLALSAAPKPQPEPLQRERDEREALKQTWSDEVDIDSLLLTDDGLSYRRDGVPPNALNRLRRGEWALQAELDLHGLRRDEARDALQGFLRQARVQGLRCVRVVHGKGHGSPGREPVLKVRVQRWLAQAQEVLAFAQASGPQGGAGALLVLLVG
jgi:DNA-nicking Smr family endonuclease